MKKTITTMLLALSVAAVAQPTINSQNVGWNVGDSFQMVTYATGSYNVGSAGANGNYDFSACTGNVSTVTNQNPSDVPGNAAFTATVAQNNASASLFVVSNANEIAVSGLLNAATSMVFSNPMSYVNLPMSYNTTLTDDYVADFTSAGTTYHRTGTSTMQADGYGTLHLPWGNINNVLRVHFTSDMLDESNLIDLTYTYDGYYFLSPGYHTILASVMTITMLNNPTTTVSYVAANPVGVEEQTVEAKLEVYPVPAGNSLTFSSDVPVQSFSIYNSMGQMVETVLTGNQRMHSIDVSSLPAGIYTYQAILDERRVSGTFVKE